uniref:Cytochrome c biogenesis protein CcsA n=1 Tax=Mesotaenium endlicherianum TaxID=184485 RepID=A0A024B3W0_9VIRI|nr:protein involved in cytochrome c biogenesis [Mesotaenium endlicherianum]AHZ11229.1 protein involved in cytochrome c biogenesis [Mesotaenium endlicherianum]
MMTLAILEAFLTPFGLITLLLATLLLWASPILAHDKRVLFFHKIAATLANASITGLLLLRWLISGHLPISNLYESTMFLSWNLTLLHLVLSHKKIQPWIGPVLIPSATLIYAFTTFALPTKMQQSTLLVPALQSNWLMMHVSMMMLSYGALLSGSLLAVTLLIVKRLLVAKESYLSVWGQPFFSAQEKRSLTISPSLTFHYANYFLQIELACLKVRQEALTEQLDHWSYRTIGIGFPLLTVGILSGAVWANEAWGSYWTWDPKEVWALVTWLTFAAYLHIRLRQGWEGEKPAILASVGFFVVWVCYLGVNLLGRGLHSYGWIQ